MNTILEYFVDKIYVYDDRFVITWYYINDEIVIDLDTFTEITDTITPAVKYHNILLAQISICRVEIGRAHV